MVFTRTIYSMLSCVHLSYSACPFSIIILQAPGCIENMGDDKLSIQAAQHLYSKGGTTRSTLNFFSVSLTWSLEITSHQVLSKCFIHISDRKTKMLSRVSQWLKTQFWLVIEFINNLQVVSTINYYTIATLHNIQFLHTHAFSLSALVLTGLQHGNYKSLTESHTSNIT
jgi:hypothetical protein